MFSLSSILLTRWGFDAVDADDFSEGLGYVLSDGMPDGCFFSIILGLAVAGAVCMEVAAVKRLTAFWSSWNWKYLPGV